MWLERFAGSISSGSPDRFSRLDPPGSAQKPGLVDINANRRRPAYLERNSSRSESLFGVSTESLPGSTRVLSTNNLKVKLQSSTVTDGPEPYEVLDSIIGNHSNGDHLSAPHHSSLAPGTAFIAPPALANIDELADMALDPSSTSTEVQSPWTVITSEQDKYNTLHDSIAACHEILMSVELYLNSFRTELATVSSEIEHLQERSAGLHKQLEMRQRVQNLLAPAVTNLITPPAAVRKLTEGNIDEAWVRTLRELQQRLMGLGEKPQETTGEHASEGMLPFLQKVSDRANERIRDHVVAQIKALRSPNIDAQIIQQAGFLQHRNAFKFLAHNQPRLAEDITQAYINTMSWYYLNNFTRYRLSLDKLNLYATDHADIFATEKAAKKGIVFDLFTLGRRIDLLLASNQRAMSTSAAEDDKGIHFIEVPFRSFNLALVDNASTEYMTMHAFFEQQSFAQTNKHFTSVFGATFELGHSFTRRLIEQSMDALGILLCIRLTQQFAFELQRRKVPAMDGYINGTNMALWPRFQTVIDGHCLSLKKAASALTGRPVNSALTLSSASVQTTAPHPYTQRFANFVHGILLLSERASDDEPVAASLGRLRVEFESFLTKMSKSIAENKKRERFLHNNFSLICTIWADLKGRLAEDIRNHFSELRDALPEA